MKAFRGLIAAAAVLSLTLSQGLAQDARTGASSTHPAWAEFQTSAPRAILIDTASGAVLFEKAADEPFAPASMAKLMTAEMVFRALKDGRLTMDTAFTVSETAWRLGSANAGGSLMYAQLNSRIRITAVQARMDLGGEALRQALNAFSSEAAQADWAVIYFAGHGLEVGRVNYLLPVDAQLKSDRAVSFEAVSLDQVLGAVEGARKLRVVILDACRDNPFLARMSRSDATRTTGTRGLGRIEPEQSGTVVAYAAKPGQLAKDGTAGQANSPFAAALTKHMIRPGVEIRKLLGLVRDEVLASTAGDQEPYTSQSLGGEDYFFKTP